MGLKWIEFRRTVSTRAVSVLTVVVSDATGLGCSAFTNKAIPKTANNEITINFFIIYKNKAYPDNRRDRQYLSKFYFACEDYPPPYEGGSSR